MHHKPFAEISHVADVRPAAPMLRRERLERWAEVLEREPDRVLNSLDEIEWKPRILRAAIRADNSALTVAFNDPVLRAEGLASDRLGDAMDFFQLSYGDAHFGLCSCLHGVSMTATGAAMRVRELIRRDAMAADLRPFLFVGGASAAAILAGALVLIPH